MFATLLSYITEAVSAVSAFEAGSPYTLNIPAFKFTLGVSPGVTVELGPISLPLKKG